MSNKSHFFRQSSGGVIGSPFLNFRFEESIIDDNTVIDNIGGLNATLTGNKTVRENTGAIERGYKFDGSTKVELQPMTLQYPFCIKFWANLNNNPSSSVGISSFNDFYFGNDINYSNNKIRISFGKGGTPASSNRITFETSNTISSSNEWKSFLFVVRGYSDFDLYVDGIKYTGSFTRSGLASSSDLGQNIVFNIGYSIWTQTNFNLTFIDELTFFNSELLASEVLEIYNKESNGIRVF